jgi:putative tryptophan/tyrosine transport system substrate-binding protein
MFGLREAVEDGGLMSYGETLSRSHFRAAYFVDRIAGGTAPADLPVEQPTTAPAPARRIARLRPSGAISVAA